MILTTKKQGNKTPQNLNNNNKKANHRAQNYA